MPTPQALLLTAGGPRSLVAAAVLAQGPDPLRVTALLAADGRPAHALRKASAQAQTEALRLHRFAELPLPHVFAVRPAHDPHGRPIGRLAWPQLLLAAMGYAMSYQIERVVWPVAVDADPDAAARAIETVLLATQLAETDTDSPPRIETPLLELSDKQVVELGAQLGVDWSLAWSCLRPGRSACGGCVACRRRRAAFAAAGVPDAPATEPAGV